MKTAVLLLFLALPALAQVMFVPVPINVTGASSCTGHAMNASNIRTGMTFTTTDTAITGVVFRVGAVTTGGNVVVRLYGVDSSGFPTGAPTTLATVTISAPNVFYTATWNAQAINPSTVYALMLEFDSYSGQNFQAHNCYGNDPPRPFSPVYFNGSSWSSVGVLLWILGSDGYILKETAYPLPFRNGFEFSSSSSPNERGIACTFTFAARAFAVQYFGGTLASGPAVVNVYKNGVLLESKTSPLATSAHAYAAVPVNVAIEPGVEYIAAVRPTTTTNTQLSWWRLSGDNFPASQSDARRMFGQSQCIAVYRTGTEEWTYDDSTWHPIQFVVVPGGV